MVISLIFLNRMILVEQITILRQKDWLNSRKNMQIAYGRIQLHSQIDRRGRRKPFLSVGSYKYNNPAKSHGYK